MTQGNASAKTVAVIGAGPAGLVSTKYLLDAGLKPTIFDKSSSIGGLWSPEGGTWDNLTTNLSRNTCSFSDMPWSTDPGKYLPKLELFSYLNAYADKHLGAILGTSDFKLNTEVSKVDLLPGAGVGDTRWRLEWKDTGGQHLQEIFDHVVVTTGFFSQPNLPTLPGTDTFPGPLLHNSKYRSPALFASMKVVVVGGSISAIDIAADLAPVAKEVVQVVPKGMWLLPKYLPLEPANPATSFAPLDWVLFRRKPPMPPGAPAPTPQQMWRAGHGMFRSMLGDQGHMIHPVFAVEEEGPPYVATMPDAYPSLVKAGKIQLVSGRLQAIDHTQLLLDNGACIEDVDAVILCTGYTTGLSYLSEEVLSRLDFCPSDRLLPTLTHRSVFHPQLPGMAFVGMYKNPHMVVMEQQARWVSAVLSGTCPLPPETEMAASIAQLAKMRGMPKRPQLLAFIVDLADGYAKEVGISPPESTNKPGTILLPQHFAGEAEEVERAEQVVAHQLERFRSGEMVAGRVFRSLQGEWSLQQTVEHQTSTVPSTTTIGMASFTMGSSPSEYLYSEASGTTGTTGSTAVWTYNDKQDVINVQIGSAESEDGKPSFHSLKFMPPGAAQQPSSTAEAQSAVKGQQVTVNGQQSKVNQSKPGWKAEGTHVPGRGECVTETLYRFAFSGVHLFEFEVSHRVSRPDNDYTTTTLFTRPLTSGSA